MAWEDTLQDASFRGVKFDCQTTSDGVQRDVQRHAYPYVAGEDLEDLGRSARPISVRAILWGDDYEERLASLINALEEPGPGELIHPVFGSVERAQVENWRIEHEAESRDSCIVQIQFLQDKPAAPFFVRQLPGQKAAQAKNLSETAGAAGFDAFGKRIKELTSTAGILGRLNAMRSVMNQTISSIRGIAQVGGGLLDVLEYPNVFVSDLQTGLRGIIDLRKFGSYRIPDWRQVSGIFKDVVLLPASLKDGERPTSFKTSKTASETASNTPISVHPDDLVVIESVVDIVVATELAELAADILEDEAQNPTLSPHEIEIIVNDVRELIQTAIDCARTVYPIEQSRPISEPLKSTALAIQDAAIAVMDTRPPLVKKTVEVPGNLHLLAFRWYGDYTRAAELARLNPKIRNPNNIKAGEVLYAYQR